MSPAGWTGLPPFLWGAATSAHQVEGGQTNDWTRWEEAGKVPERSGNAMGHWQAFEQDLSYLSQMGLNAYRFSLEWSRIEPERGRFDPTARDRYRAMVDACRARGIEPVLTLYHFTLPLWFADAGGWLAPDATARFQAFVRYVMPVFGDVRIVVTVNEPTVLAVMSELRGVWPPGGTSPVKAWRVARVLLRAHEHAYRLVKQESPSTLVGLAHHLIRFLPEEPGPADVLAARLAHHLFNVWPITKTLASQDFVGVNYYTHQYVHWPDPAHPRQAKLGEPLTDMGWAVDPVGLEEALVQLAVYRRPLLVLENGMATDDDSLRGQFITAHADALSRARSRGADVRGYFYWSLLDNFEWAEGYRPHFGLLASSPGRPGRTVRQSSQVLTQRARQGMP